MAKYTRGDYRNRKAGRNKVNSLSKDLRLKHVDKGSRHNKIDPKKIGQFIEEDIYFDQQLEIQLSREWEDDPY